MDNSVDVVVHKIKLLREMNNYTQQYVADELELSQNAYSLLEKGMTKITIERLDQIAKFYKISITELFTEEAVPSKSVVSETIAPHTNTPPVLTPMEKLMYESTIKHFEESIARLYKLIDQLVAKLNYPREEEPWKVDNDLFR